MRKSVKNYAAFCEFFLFHEKMLVIARYGNHALKIGYGVSEKMLKKTDANYHTADMIG